MDYWEGLFLPSAIRHPLNAPSHDQEHVNLCSTALAQSENLITFWIVMIAVLRQSLSDHAWPPDLGSLTDLFGMVILDFRWLFPRAAVRDRAVWHGKYANAAFDSRKVQYAR
jgi:hypothetical protein